MCKYWWPLSYRENQKAEGGELSHAGILRQSGPFSDDTSRFLDICFSYYNFPGSQKEYVY